MLHHHEWNADVDNLPRVIEGYSEIRMDFSHIRGCSDLSDDIFALASASRDDAYRLLDRMSEICEPNAGEVAVLEFLARCALRSWLDGDLRVEVLLDGVFRCTVRILRGIGGESFEVLKRINMSASFLAFRGTAGDPKRLAPFRLTHAEANRLVFDAPSSVRMTTIPPPAYARAQRRVEEKLARGKHGEPLAHAVVEPDNLGVWRATDSSPRPVGRITLEKRWVQRPLAPSQRDDDSFEDLGGLLPLVLPSIRPEPEGATEELTTEMEEDQVDRGWE